MEIEKGLCQCGCGKKTGLAPCDNDLYGWVKGEPFRFIRGHSGRGRKCSVEGCTGKNWGRDLCCKHYQRWKKKGSATARTIKDPNEFVDCGGYWEIKLYDKDCNHVASAKIDCEDVEKCRKYKWWFSKGDRKVYSDSGLTRIALHRFVMNIIDPLLDGDHIHGDTLDNRKSQLRECSHAQNCQNAKLNKSNTSGVKNVSWNTARSQWCVNIKAFGKIYRKYFDDFEEACEHAEVMAVKLHGEFVRRI